MIEYSDNIKALWNKKPLYERLKEARADERKKVLEEVEKRLTSYWANEIIVVRSIERIINDLKGEQ